MRTTFLMIYWPSIVGVRIVPVNVSWGSTKNGKNVPTIWNTMSRTAMRIVRKNRKHTPIAHSHRPRMGRNQDGSTEMPRICLPNRKLAAGYEPKMNNQYKLFHHKQ